jgi:hypothetical protein
VARTPQFEDVVGEVLDEVRDGLEGAIIQAVSRGVEGRVILLALHWQAASMCLEAGIDPAALTSAIHAVRAMLGGEAEGTQAGRES